MSWYCIHEHVWDGNFYEPPESWCELDKDCYCSDDCPYRYSKEDYDADRADYAYDRYKYEKDFC